MQNSMWIVVLFIFLISCKAEKHPNTPVVKIQSSYPQTVLPADTTGLWVADGRIAGDTVLIICQGGPAKNLTFVEKGRTSYRYIPNYSKYSIAYLHQAQTLNKEIFNFRNDFTLEMAKEEVRLTSEILYRAIRYFKNKHKHVIVLGTSYGGYIIPNYLTNHPSIADKYIIMAARIDDDEQAVAQHLKGFNGEFGEDGKTYLPEDENADLSQYSEKDKKNYRIKQLLKGAIGQPRYSQKLANHDLSNIVYFYAANDQNVGSLTASEINFLQSKGAQVFETKDGHSETLYRFIDKLVAGDLQL